MEQRLGWFVGVAGAVLVGAVSPLLLLTTSIQSRNTTSENPARPSAAVTSHNINVPSTSSAPSVQGVRAPMFTYHIRQAGISATQAVGGGTVKKLLPDHMQGHGVWRVYVNNVNEQWLVTVSKHDYSVVNKVKLT